MALVLRRLNRHLNTGRESRLLAVRYFSGWDDTDNQRERAAPTISSYQQTKRYSIHLDTTNSHIEVGKMARAHHTYTRTVNRIASSTTFSSMNNLIGDHFFKQSPFLYSSFIIRPLSNQVTPSSDYTTKSQTSEAKIPIHADPKSSSIIKQTSSATPIAEKTFLGKIGDSLLGAGKATVSFISKIPGLLWFYITHSKERHEKWIEIKEAAKKEAHHYWMGTKVNEHVLCV